MWYIHGLILRGADEGGSSGFSEEKRLYQGELSLQRADTHRQKNKEKRLYFTLFIIKHDQFVFLML